jgi:hypothetical protein
MKWGMIAVSSVAMLVSTPACATETATYTYDALGRVTGAAHSGSVNNGQQATVTYDAADNRSNYAVTIPPPATITIGNASTTEGGNVVFTVTRSGNTANAVTVNWATASGSATSGSDFTAGSGTLSFAANQTSATITVATIDDTLVESTETMSVTLSGASSGATIATATGTGTILDNDTPANLAIGNASTTEGGSLVFTITRSGNTANAVTVNWATAGGTATSGSDFTAGSGTLSFAANQTSATITVATIDDTIVESTEAMSVTLSGASSGATITTATGTGTILDNDVAWSSSMTAGSSTSCTPYVCYSYKGYRSGSFGSMTNTNWTGYTITGVFTFNSTLILAISGTSAPPDSGWTSITIPGIGTFTRATGGYSTSGNVSTWGWAATPPTAGTVYTVTIQ